MAHRHWMLPEWFTVDWAVVLLGVLAHALARGRRVAGFPRDAQASIGLQRVTLGIAGMTCSHCSSAVQRALLEVPGVQAVRVDLAGGSAQVDWDRPPQEAVALARAVEVLGYNVTATEVGDAGP
jgi:copper chaperone CopZ